jgi:hypothetical protein
MRRVWRRETYSGDDKWVQSRTLIELSSIRRPESDFFRTLGGFETGFERHTEVGYSSVLSLQVLMMREMDILQGPTSIPAYISVSFRREVEETYSLSSLQGLILALFISYVFM